jgi:urease accessory protein
MESYMIASLRRAALLAAPLLLAAAPASAHHVMGGRTPSTFLEGLLSGLAHPVIGLDHLAFLVAIGLVVGLAGLSLLLPVAFVLAMAAGVVLHVQGIGLPVAEYVVAASVVLAGIALLLRLQLPVAAWGAIFAIAGLFHGYALGESIYGAERAALGAYLLGLVAIQSALTVGIALATRRLDTRVAAQAPRFAGVLIIGIGLAATVISF